MSCYDGGAREKRPSNDEEAMPVNENRLAPLKVWTLGVVVADN